MKTFFVRLILIHLMAIIFAGAAFAAPLILSGSWEEAVTRCRLVTVQALTEVQGQVFYQQGIGWVIHGDFGYRILTPAHVVAGAQVLIAECNGKTTVLRLQSRTETKDLALLEPVSDFSSVLYPLITFQEREKFLSPYSKEQKKLFGLLHPDHFAQPLENRLYDQIYNSYVVPAGNGVQIYKSYERDVSAAGVAHFENKLNSLVSESLAIRPGYSGAPLLAQVPAPVLDEKNSLTHLLMPDTYFQSYLLGMLTKAEINGSRSLGVSLPEILQILPKLLATNDAALDVFASGDLQLKYKMTFDGENLIRSQILVSKGHSYSEICQDTMAESSEWDKKTESASSLSELIRTYKNQTASGSFISIEPKKKSTGKEAPKLKYAPENTPAGKIKSFEQKSGGGDYGEGGGSASLKNSLLMTPANSPVGMGGFHLTSYKRLSTCAKASLVDPQGRGVDHLQSAGRIFKTTTLSEAYDVLSGKATGASLCPTYNLNEVMSTWTNYPQHYTYGRHEGLAVESSKIDEAQLQCVPKLDVYNLRFTDSRDILRLNVTLGSPAKSSGTISIGNESQRCEVPVNAKAVTQVNRWRYRIRTPQIDMDIAIGTEGRLLSIKILRMNQECDPGYKTFWMQEYNFSSPEQVIRASRPISILRGSAKEAL